MRIFARTTLPLDMIRDKLTEEEAAAVSALRPEELSQCMQITGFNCERITDNIAMTVNLNILFNKELALQMADGRISNFLISKELEKINVPEVYQSPGVKSKYLTACRMILEFLQAEYGNAPSADIFIDPTRIGVAYTTLGENENYQINAYVDLIHRSVLKEIDGLRYEENSYPTLSDMIEKELQYLNFDELIRTGLDDEELADWIKDQGEELE